MMDKKAIIAIAVGCVVTFFVTAFLTSGKDIFDRGTDAIAADQIRTILKEEMQVDINGETKTYGQVLSSMHTKLTAMEATMGVLTEE